MAVALLGNLTPLLRGEAEAAVNSGRYYARTWQTDDGLPRNTVTAITQTPDGYLWLGTPQGVIRFDGVKFTPMEDDIFAGFIRARTRVLYVDRFQRLWIGTGTTGVIRYDGTGFVVIDGRNGLPHPTINAISEDSNGTIWLACQNGSLSWVGADDVVHPVASPTGKAASDPIQLVRDMRGRLWFAQNDTYGQLIGGAATNVTRIPNSLVVLCPSRDGGMWLSANDELQKLPAPESDAVAKVESMQSPVKDYQVQTMLEDHRGNLWIGTRGLGLFRYADHQFTREFSFSHRILALCEDAELSVWIGTEGGGLSRLRPRLFRTVNVRDGFPNPLLVSVCEGADGAMWLSSQGPNLTTLATNGQTTILPAFTNISTTCVLPDPDGSVWVGTVNQGLYSIRDGKEMQLPSWNSLRNRQIRVLHRDAKGQLWIGCLPDGLAQW
ncbi:MAG: ligand-binding sensor domain-containing protein, partial [Verrucomicrobiota bacterium]